MSTLPRDQKFKIEDHLASLLIMGQTVIINGTTFIVKNITLIPGSYKKVLVASRVPYLRLDEIETP